jgi:hypothetical protein
MERTGDKGMGRRNRNWSHFNMDCLLLQFANLLSLMDPVVPTRYVQCVTAHEATYVSL